MIVCHGGNPYLMVYMELNAFPLVARTTIYAASIYTMLPGFPMRGITLHIKVQDDYHKSPKARISSNVPYPKLGENVH